MAVCGQVLSTRGVRASGSCQLVMVLVLGNLAGDLVGEHERGHDSRNHLHCTLLFECNVMESVRVRGGAAGRVGVLEEQCA